MDNFQIAQSQFFTALLHLIKKNVAWFLISKDIAAFSTCNQIETLKTVYNAILVSTTFIIWLKIYIWATISPISYIVDEFLGYFLLKFSSIAWSHCQCNASCNLKGPFDAWPSFGAPGSPKRAFKSVFLSFEPSQVRAFLSEPILG